MSHLQVSNCFRFIVKQSNKLKNFLTVSAFIVLLFFGANLTHLAPEEAKTNCVNKKERKERKKGKVF